MCVVYGGLYVGLLVVSSCKELPVEFVEDDDKLCWMLSAVIVAVLCVCDSHCNY